VPSLSPLPPLPTDEEAAAARECARVLSAYIRGGTETSRLGISDDSGGHHYMEVPASTLMMIANILGEIGKGNAVSIESHPADLATHEAASLLNVSHSAFLRLLNEGEIPSCRIGLRRRVLYSDVIACKKRRRAELEKKLEELDRQANPQAQIQPINPSDSADQAPAGALR